jgi:hypothetical protein
MIACPVCLANMSSAGDVLYEEDKVIKINPIFIVVKKKKIHFCSQKCKTEYEANPKEFQGVSTNSDFVPKPPQ